MTTIPTILDGLPVHWAGVDDTTPDGCSLVVTTFLDVTTTYVVRDGQVIGRIEIDRNRMYGYAGGQLKGGTFLGPGDSQTLAEKIVAFGRR